MSHTKLGRGVALVTGAGDGIGQATVLQLARDGWTVVGCGTDRARLNNTGKLLVAQSTRADLVLADITSPEEINRLMARLPDGRLDLLANVAYTSAIHQPGHPPPPRSEDRSLTATLISPMRLCLAVIPAMRSAGRGVTVNVSSRRGLHGFTRTLASLFAADSIRTTSIGRAGPAEAGAQGWYERAAGGGIRPGSRPSIGRLRWSERDVVATIGMDGIAALISWLATDEASDLNGAVVTATGGWS
jgi:NAD(P)-dependent dehydrogenase (short-subunit alcohol dehydrogenase family)